MNNTISFADFILKDQKNRRYLLIALCGTIIQFIIFKLLYPYADFFSDSYSYLYAAYANLDINIWPIGYSKFLRVLHFITHSDTILVGIQYFFLEISSGYFFFTLLYFYRPTNAINRFLLIVLFFNPLALYISNYVNSDPLFAALSLLWFTQLIWIINRPKTYQIFVQAILLFLAFTVRNNAYYYPLVAASTFLLSKQSIGRKLAGIIMPLIFILPFIIYTREAAYKITGTRQFSLFTGWQLANNALYAYGHMKVDNAQLPSAETRKLDRISKNYFAKLQSPAFDTYLFDYVANYFIRQPDAPLKQYFEKNYELDSDDHIIAAWGQASIVFGEYGSWLIKHNPIPFARYYLLVNTKNYFLPPLEKLEVYNLGLDQVAPIAKFWFNYKSDKVTSVSKDLQGILLYIYPLLFMAVNLYYLASIITLLLRKKLDRILILNTVFLFINFGFSVFATMNVLRYQLFPLLLCLSFSGLLMQLSNYKEAASDNGNRANNPAGLLVNN